MLLGCGLVLDDDGLHEVSVWLFIFVMNTIHKMWSTFRMANLSVKKQKCSSLVTSDIIWQQDVMCSVECLRMKHQFLSLSGQT